MLHQELATLGRIVAESAHDLNNVLAVTRDAGGLLRDILDISKTENALTYRDKLERIADSVDRQTKRGATAAKALNRFAHLTDQESGELDLPELLLLSIELTHRHAASFQTAVNTARMARPLRLKGSAMRTLLLMTACLRACIEACAGKEVRVSTVKSKQGAEVRFAPPEGWDIPLPELADQSLEENGATMALDQGAVVLRFAAAEGGKGLRLRLW